MSGWRPGHSWPRPAMSAPACCWLVMKMRTVNGRWGFWIWRFLQPTPWGWPRSHGEFGRSSQAEETVQVRSAASSVAEPDLYRNLFRHEREYWTIAYDGSVMRLPDAKGCAISLGCWPIPAGSSTPSTLRPPSRRQHRLRRVCQGGGSEPELTVRPDLGDAGVLLDATAKAAYRSRIMELRAELEEAEAFNDIARAANARAELDFLMAELARAVIRLAGRAAGDLGGGQQRRRCGDECRWWSWKGSCASRYCLDCMPRKAAACSPAA
jgi:hypothetical protein